MALGFGNRSGVLFIGPGSDGHASLQRIFRDSPWELHAAFTGREGLDLLRRSPGEFAVLICEHRLPDGDWKWVLAELDHLPVRPSLIVSSHLADERLWAEVLNLGAFDLLLANPFVREEVLRVTDSACRSRADAALPRMPLRPPEEYAVKAAA